MNSKELKKAYRYCESMTRLHAKSFYFAAKFLPRHKQKAVYAIYAFCRHVDDAIDEIGENEESEAVKIVEEWKQRLEEVFEGKIDREKGKGKSEDQSSRIEVQNSVFIAWRDLLKKHNIPRELPLELIKGVVRDTYQKRYETFSELYIYCYRVASTVGLMASEILGFTDKKALEYAEAMGIGMQLTNILRDIKEDAAMNRIYLPQEDLRKYEISEDQIFDNKMSENFVRMMKFQIKRARDFYARGEKGIALLEKDSRFTVLLAARVYAQILDEIEKQNYDVFTKRAHTTKIQKLISIPKIWIEAKSL